MNNPLLDFSDLPLFDRILPEHVAPAVTVLLGEADAALARVTAPDFPASWGDIARVLDVATENLGRAWGAVGHLNSVADTPELRAAYNAALARVTEFGTRLGGRRAPVCQIQSHRYRQPEYRATSGTQKRHSQLCAVGRRAHW